MTDNLLPSNIDGTPNGCIVAAIADPNSNHHDDNKLKNCSLNGNINSINLKNGLNKSKFDSVNHANEPATSTEPPDGGARALCVMFSAFLCNSIIFGIINTYGTIYGELHAKLKVANDSEAASKAGRCRLLSIDAPVYFFFTFFLFFLRSIDDDEFSYSKMCVSDSMSACFRCQKPKYLIYF